MTSACRNSSTIKEKKIKLTACPQKLADAKAVPTDCLGSVSHSCTRPAGRPSLPAWPHLPMASGLAKSEGKDSLCVPSWALACREPEEGEKRRVPC